MNESQPAQQQEALFPETSLPLFTLAWQHIQQWHTHMQRCKQMIHLIHHRENEVLLGVANAYQRLAQFQANLPPDEAVAKVSSMLHGTIQQLGELLQQAEVEVVAPIGVPYTPELADLIDSAGQVYDVDLEVATIQEVIMPAIKRAGDILQLGKAIIALPQPATTNEAIPEATQHPTINE